VLAYDKTLLEKGAGTNVLYLDCHVAFETLEVLERLGILSAPKSAEALRQEVTYRARFKALENLKRVGLAVLIYANEHDDRLPADLNELDPYLARDEELRSWVGENVEYVGKGLTTGGTTEAFKTPVAYCQLPSGEFAMVFLDGHAVIAEGFKFKELGIEVPPRQGR
jgi:prepilin-type processing-associated H-X9-DG protein